MASIKRGPKGGSYYISDKGKKVYSKKAPEKAPEKAKAKPKDDPLDGLDSALVAKIRANPAAMKRLGLSPSESSTLVDLKKAKESKSRSKEKARPKPKLKPKPKSKSKEKPKEKPKDDSATKQKKDTRRYLSGDDASPAEIKKMETAESKKFKSLNRSEQDAIKAYTGDDYETINKKLRSGGPPSGHAVEMDKALAKSSLSHDMEVHRGFTLEGRPPPKIGSVMQDNAYMSTSHGQRRAEGFTSRTDESVLMKVKVPKGSKAIYVGGNSKYGNEQELLLDRGAQVKFTSRKKIGNVWHYEAELVSTHQSRL